MQNAGAKHMDYGQNQNNGADIIERPTVQPVNANEGNDESNRIV